MRINISAQFIFAVLTSKDKISWDGNARAPRSCRGDSTTRKSNAQNHLLLFSSTKSFTRAEQEVPSQRNKKPEHRCTPSCLRHLQLGSDV